MVVYSMRPLTALEVIHAVRIETAHDFSDYSGVERLLRMVGGLIVKRRDGTLALEHQVLHDFISENDTVEMLDIRPILAKACVHAILSGDGFNFADMQSTGYNEGQRAKEKYPFVAYAVAFWGFHLRDLEESIDDDLREKALRIFSQERLVQACSKGLERSKVNRVHPAFLKGGSPVHLAAAFDLSPTLHELIQRRLFSFELLDEQLNTPLHWAAQFGASSTSSLLLRLIDMDAFGQNSDEESDPPGLLQSLKLSTRLGFSGGLERRGPSSAPTKMIHVRNTKGRTALSEAAESGNAKIVRLLLQKDPALCHLKDNFGCTPLFLAATDGHKDIVDMLLDAGSDVNVDCRLHTLPWEPGFDMSFTVLSSTCVMGHQNLVRTLLERPMIDIDLRGPMGMSALAYAAESGNTAIARLLLSKGANVNSLSRNNRTPLSYAAESARVYMVELLLQQHGVDINVADKDGRTAFSYAAERGDPDTAKALLKHPVTQPHLADYSNRTPLSYAAERGYANTVKALLEEPGILPHLADNNDRTPLSYASEGGNSETVDLLLAAPQSAEDQLTAGVDFKSRWGCTALYYGARSGRLSVMEKLLAAGANPNATRNSYGETPLFCAVEKGFVTIAELLLSHNADPNVLVQPDTTPLCYAVENGFTSIADALIRNKADLNLGTPKTGRTPVCIAAFVGSDSLLRQLATNGADMDKPSLSGWTPACFATDTRHDRAFRTLLELGVDVHAGPPGETPLLIAAGQGVDPVVELLLAKNLLTQDDRREAMHCSARKGHGATVCLFLQRLPVDATTLDDDGSTTFGRYVAEIFPMMHRVKDEVFAACMDRKDFNVNQRDHDGRTLFWWACNVGDTAFISKLCAAPRIDVNLTDKAGISPLRTVVDGLLQPRWDMVDLGLIMESLTQLVTIDSLDMNALDSDGRTLLMRSVTPIGPSSRVVVEILLSRRDVDVGIVDHKGETALSYARSQKLGWPSGVVELLENYQHGANV
jgi:ankyrin repeat protein